MSLLKGYRQPGREITAHALSRHCFLPEACAVCTRHHSVVQALRRLFVPIAASLVHYFQQSNNYWSFT